jgi:hypothetical protein
MRFGSSTLPDSNHDKRRCSRESENRLRYSRQTWQNGRGRTTSQVRPTPTTLSLSLRRTMLSFPDANRLYKCNKTASRLLVDAAKGGVDKDGDIARVAMIRRSDNKSAGAGHRPCLEFITDQRPLTRAGKIHDVFSCREKMPKVLM